MRCPNCNEVLKDDAKVCSSCGEDVSKQDIDHMIRDIIKEDEQQSTLNQPTQKKSVQNQKVTNAKLKPVYGQAYRITAYITAFVITIFLLTMFMDWFGLSGRGVVKGFIFDGNSGQFMSEDVKGLNAEQKDALDISTEFLQFSPKELYSYTSLYEDQYIITDNSTTDLKKSWTVVIQTIYIKALLVVALLGLMSVLLLLIDRHFYTIGITRGFSIVAVIVIVLNYAVLKIPFFSMFALRARSLLRAENLFNAVTMNLNGININNEFYPYKLIEKNGFFVAIGACCVWFILSTVIIEMKKDKAQSLEEQLSGSDQKKTE